LTIVLNHYQNFLASENKPVSPRQIAKMKTRREASIGVTESSAIPTVDTDYSVTEFEL